MYYIVYSFYESGEPAVFDDYDEAYKYMKEEESYEGSYTIATLEELMR